MIHKPLNLLKITRGYALGLGLLIGSIPIAKAESLFSGSKYPINVHIYKECTAEAASMSTSQTDNRKADKGGKAVISTILSKATDYKSYKSAELQKLKNALAEGGCKLDRTYTFQANPKLVDDKGDIIPENMFKIDVNEGNVILAHKTDTFQNNRPVICAINKNQDLTLMTIKSRILKQKTKNLIPGFSGISGDAGLTCAYKDSSS